MAPTELDQARKCAQGYLPPERPTRLGYVYLRVLILDMCVRVCARTYTHIRDCVYWRQAHGVSSIKMPNEPPT